MPTAVPSCAAVLMMPDAPPRQRDSTSVPRLVAATDDSPIPSPAPAAQAPTAHELPAGELPADGIRARSAIPIAASPSAITHCGRSRRCSTADRLAPAMTATLNGSRVAAACSGLRRSVFCRYRVTSVRAELVVAVFRSPPSAPWRSRQDRTSSGGSSGAAARRSATAKAPASTTQAASTRPPAT
jgi:hypothetical protein